MPSQVEVEVELERGTYSPAADRSTSRPLPAFLLRMSRASTLGFATLVGVAAFVVYLRTLAPSIVWGDSPELTAAAFCAGVPHPTGYPLYMLLAHTFLILCPLGSIAYRMNLLSALSAAFAVALIYPLMRRCTRSHPGSLAATLLFAFSPLFWSQAVIAEVYAFQMLGTAAVLGCTLAWDARGERRWLFASAFVYGLCATHHGMSALLLPGLLCFALTSRHRSQFLRELPRTVPLFLLPLSLYLYLPLAALRNPPLDWGDPRTWRSFLAHVSGEQYRPLMFHTTRAHLWAHARDYLGLGKNSAGFLPAQFGLGLLGLAPLGAASLARRRPRHFGLTLLVYLADLLYALNYSVFDVDVYYLPSHLMVALWIGCGLRQVGVWLVLLWRRLALAPAKRRPLNAVLGGALMTLPLTLLVINWRENDHHQDWSALVYARGALATLKPHAILIGGGDYHYAPLLYPHFVEHQRPDVTLLATCEVASPPRVRLVMRLASHGLIVRVPPDYGSDPRASIDNRLLAQLVKDNLGRRPIYVLERPEALRMPWLADVMAPYYQIADSNVSRVELIRSPPPLAIAQPRPQRDKRQWFGPLRPDGRVGHDLELLGYDVEPFHRVGFPLLRMRYYWRLNNPALTRPITVWVLFTDAAGNYRQKDDGSPDFENIHPLAYGIGQRSLKLPQTLEETFTLYVPPAEWDQRLHIRMAVALAGKFLPNGTHGTPWIEMEELPPASAVEQPRCLASAGPLGGRD